MECDIRMSPSRPGFSEAEARAIASVVRSMPGTLGQTMLHVYTILDLALGFGEARATVSPTD